MAYSKRMRARWGKPSARLFPTTNQRPRRNIVMDTDRRRAGVAQETLPVRRPISRDIRKKNHGKKYRGYPLAPLRRADGWNVLDEFVDVEVEL
jgi:hypothetical protein